MALPPIKDAAASTAERPGVFQMVRMDWPEKLPDKINKPVIHKTGQKNGAYGEQDPNLDNKCLK